MGTNGYDFLSIDRDVEMQPMIGQPAANNDPNAILNECQQISASIRNVDSQMSSLRQKHSNFLQGVTNSTSDIDRIYREIVDTYKGLTEQVRRLKGRRDAGSPRNAPQIGKVDRDLKRAIHEVQRLDADFRRSSSERAAREYRIVNPAATEDEVRQATEDPYAPVFQQAVSFFSDLNFTCIFQGFRTLTNAFAIAPT